MSTSTCIATCISTSTSTSLSVSKSIFWLNSYLSISNLNIPPSLISCLCSSFWEPPQKPIVKAAS